MFLFVSTFILLFNFFILPRISSFFFLFTHLSFLSSYSVNSLPYFILLFCDRIFFCLLFLVFYLLCFFFSFPSFILNLFRLFFIYSLLYSFVPSFGHSFHINTLSLVTFCSPSHRIFITYLATICSYFLFFLFFSSFFFLSSPSFRKILYRWCKSRYTLIKSRHKTYCIYYTNIMHYWPSWYNYYCIPIFAEPFIMQYFFACSSLSLPFLLSPTLPLSLVSFFSSLILFSLSFPSLSLGCPILQFILFH